MLQNARYRNIGARIALVLPILFRVAALFQIVCAIDELGITALLADVHHDVPSVFHALRLRRGAGAAPR